MTRYAVFLISMLIFSLGMGRSWAAQDATLSSTVRVLPANAQVADENAPDEEEENNDKDADGEDKEPDPADESDEKKDASDEDEKETSDEDKDAAEKEKKSEAAADDKKDSADEKKDEEKEKAASADGAADKKEVEKKDESKDAKGDEKTDAATAEKSAAKSDAKKRKTLKIEPKRLKIDLTLDGAFVAEKAEEIVFRPEAWTTFEIVEVAEHGQKVRKGDTLFKFDSEKLDEAIADLELEQRINELAIMKAEEELPRMEKQLKLDAVAAERSNQQAKEDFKRYREIDRPMMEKSAEFLVKYYNFNLNYEKDELEQLEKMYKEDDLTEETEEIVLKRQKNTVEFAEFSLENAKLNRDETLNISLPRYDIRIKEGLERAEMAQARARQALELDLKTARYELEQRKKARVKSLDRHSKLVADRKLMEIKAPADGVVFYGQAVNGRFGDTATLINKYKPKNNATPGTVLMTIVETRPMEVLSAVDEAKRPDVADGQKAKIALAAEDAERIGAEVKSISTIPTSPGKFEVKLDLGDSEVPDWVVPGMSCKVHITTYNKKDAIVVPKTAVHDDEEDEEQKYVWVVDPEDDDAKPERRNVKLGKRKGTDVEIVKGLKEGDVISLEDESKKDDAAEKKE